MLPRRAKLRIRRPAPTAELNPWWAAHQRALLRAAKECKGEGGAGGGGGGGGGGGASAQVDALRAEVQASEQREEALRAQLEAQKKELDALQAKLDAAPAPTADPASAAQLQAQAAELAQLRAKNAELVAARDAQAQAGAGTSTELEDQVTALEKAVANYKQMLNPVTDEELIEQFGQGLSKRVTFLATVKPTRKYPDGATEPNEEFQKRNPAERKDLEMLAVSLPDDMLQRLIDALSADKLSAEDFAEWEDIIADTMFPDDDADDDDDDDKVTRSEAQVTEAKEWIRANRLWVNKVASELSAFLQYDPNSDNKDQEQWIKTAQWLRPRLYASKREMKEEKEAELRKTAAETARKRLVENKLREADLTFCTDVLDAWLPLWMAFMEQDEDLLEIEEAKQYFEVITGKRGGSEFWTMLRTIVPLQEYDKKYPRWRDDIPKKREKRPLTLTSMGVGGTGVNPGVQFPGDKLRFKLPTHVHVAMVAMLKRHYANPQGDLGAQGKQFKDKNESVVFGELFGAARNKVAAEQKQDGFDYETFALEDLRETHAEQWQALRFPIDRNEEAYEVGSESLRAFRVPDWAAQYLERRRLAEEAEKERVRLEKEKEKERNKVALTPNATPPPPPPNPPPPPPKPPPAPPKPPPAPPPSAKTNPKVPQEAVDPKEQLMRDLRKGQSGLRKSTTGDDSPRTRTRKAQQGGQKAGSQKPETAGWEEPFVERQNRARAEKRQARSEFGKSVKDQSAAQEPKPDGFGESVQAAPESVRDARNAALAVARRPSGTKTRTTGARYGRPRLGRTVAVRPHAPFLVRPS